MPLNNFYTTAAGRELLARAVTGTPITITRAQIGDGVWPAGVNYDNITGLVRPMKWLTIAGAETGTGGQVKVTVQFSNAGIGRAFDWSEFALWAAKPEAPADRTQDILIGTSYAEPDETKPIDAGLTEFNFNVLLKVSQAASVSVLIDSSLVYVSRTEFQTFMDTWDIDCGHFVENITVAQHDAAAAAHANLTLDGNDETETADGDMTLAEHMVDEEAHQNMTVDGNGN